MWHTALASHTKILVMFLIGAVVFALDQWIKYLFLQGLHFHSSAITLGGDALVYNDGVAFSMFAFLGAYLKYIQVAMLLCLLAFVLSGGLAHKHYVAFGLILGAGASNVLDRFIHGGVVDYVFWHYGFEFAIFNFADVMIDVGVVLLIWQMWRTKPTTPAPKT